MNMRPISEADRKPNVLQPVIGTAQDGCQVGENRFWAPTGPKTGMWLALNAAGISMPMIVTHVVEDRP